MFLKIYENEDKQLLNNLYQKYASRLEKDLGINVYGEFKNQETVIGCLTAIKMNPENTQVIGEINLLLNKYVDSSITKIVTTLPDGIRATWRITNENPN